MCRLNAQQNSEITFHDLIILGANLHRRKYFLVVVVVYRASEKRRKHRRRSKQVCSFHYVFIFIQCIYELIVMSHRKNEICRKILEMKKNHFFLVMHKQIVAFNFYFK